MGVGRWTWRWRRRRWWGGGGGGGGGVARHTSSCATRPLELAAHQRSFLYTSKLDIVAMLACSVLYMYSTSWGCPAIFSAKLQPGHQHLDDAGGHHVEAAVSATRRLRRQAKATRTTFSFCTPRRISTSRDDADLGRDHLGAGFRQVREAPQRVDHLVQELHGGGGEDDWPLISPHSTGGRRRRCRRRDCGRGGGVRGSREGGGGRTGRG